MGKKTDKTKPRLFIGSSVEGKPIADAVNANLDHDFEVTLWSAGIFKPSSTAIQDLIAEARTFDFALFVFSPDDTAQMRAAHKGVIVKSGVRQVK